jgi:PAS domain S-box-containing protein
MKIDSIKSQIAAPPGLHHYAEERVNTQSADVHPSLTEEATERLVHELEVHQVELELQNDELRTAKNELETTLEKYTEFYESAPVAYFTVGRNGTISAVNLSASNLLRIERSLLIGRSFEQFVQEECHSHFTSFLESVFSSRGNEICKVVVMNNVSLPLNVQIGATVSDSGEECHLALIDITGLKAAEHLVHENVKNSSIATIETVKIKLELSDCSLREALDASLVMLSEKAREGNVTIKLDLAPEMDQRIVADHEMLKQLMCSLLSNAIGFTPAGGSVSVSAVRDVDVMTISCNRHRFGNQGRRYSEAF